MPPPPPLTPPPPPPTPDTVPCIYSTQPFDREGKSFKLISFGASCRTDTNTKACLKAYVCPTLLSFNALFKKKKKSTGGRLLTCCRIKMPAVKTCKQRTRGGGWWGGVWGGGGYMKLLSSFTATWQTEARPVCGETKPRQRKNIGLARHTVEIQLTVINIYIYRAG